MTETTPKPKARSRAKAKAEQEVQAEPVEEIPAEPLVQERIVEPIQEEQAEEKPVKKHWWQRKRPVTCKDTAKKPRKPFFRRGKHVLALVVTPGETAHDLVTLRKTEDRLEDKGQDRTFMKSTEPAFKIRNKKGDIDCYVVDSEKGCTVGIEFVRDKDMLRMRTNPETTYDVLDGHLVSQFMDLKPDRKAQIGFGLFCGVMSFMFGLMF